MIFIFFFLATTKPLHKTGNVLKGWVFYHKRRGDGGFHFLKVENDNFFGTSRQGRALHLPLSLTIGKLIGVIL